MFRGKLGPEQQSDRELIPPLGGFSHGHGFLLISLKLVKKIVKWEYVSMVELLPAQLKCNEDHILFLKNAEKESSWRTGKASLRGPSASIRSWQSCQEAIPQSVGGSWLIAPQF